MSNRSLALKPILNRHFPSIFLIEQNSQKMSAETRMLFIPISDASHQKPFLIIAQMMRDFGHKCVFIVCNDTMKDMFGGQGFECVSCYELEYRNHTIGSGGDNGISEAMYNRSPLEKARNNRVPFSARVSLVVNGCHKQLKRIVDHIKPDVIVVDCFIYTPAVVCAGIPWITIITANPLNSFSDSGLPPACSGYAMNSDKTLWDEFRRVTEEAKNDIWEEFNTWLVSMGTPPLKQRGKFYNESPFLNIYYYPKEVDYYENGRKGKNWFSIDSMIGYNVDNESKGFEIPKKLRERSGKLVYLSMGSICCDEIILMKRFVSLLSNSKHRFIVSKGKRGNEYELPDNMWGQNWLPQLQVLPIVDLVLTHGGNNTFNECLYFGKPMIGFPLIGDGYDNAQRLVDMELGVRLDPYECTQTQLFEAMDRLLNDSQLKAKYENISQRMKNSKSSEMLTKLIEDLKIKI